MKGSEFLFLIVMIFSCISLTAQEAIPPAVGSGTENDPYEIATLSNLYWISQHIDSWDKHYIQTADIDATETAFWPTGQGWQPIGRYIPNGNSLQTIPFTGSYDGQGHTIDGLHILRHLYEANLGLFGSVSGGTIQNLGLTNLYYHAYSLTGAFAGTLSNNSELNNCYSTGDIEGNRDLGGLVGYLTESSINDCYSYVNVSGIYRIGGLSAENEQSIINNSHYAGYLFAVSDAGGITGFNTSSVISNSYSNAVITAEYHIGGIAGSNDGSTIYNCYSVSDIIALNSSAGGLVGNLKNSSIENSFYNFEACTINGFNAITIGALDNLLFTAWLDNNLSLDISEYLVIDGEEYLISSVDDFKKLLAFGHVTDYSYRLTTNLDLSSHCDFYIPYFRGVFNGNGHTIENFTLNAESIPSSYSGLFGYMQDAAVNNLHVANVNLSGFLSVGGLAGYCTASLITETVVSGTIHGLSDVGGIAGAFISSQIMNSHSDVVITSYQLRNYGGLIGYSHSSLISGCSSSGMIHGNDAVGGLVGLSLEGSLITNSLSTCTVSGREVVGGLVGRSTDSEIDRCFSTGNVTAQFSVAGGLVGFLGVDLSIESLVINSFSKSNVSGEEFVGGLIGEVLYSSIENSYSTGYVDSSAYSSGGLIGWEFLGTVINSYWNTETSGKNNSAGGSGRTTQQMIHPHADNTYSNWDFTGIWDIDTNHDLNHGYPLLRDLPLNIEFEDEETDGYIVAKTEVFIYPNPFNPETTIAVTLNERDVNKPVSVTIYNLKGQRIRKLMDNEVVRTKSLHLTWNGKNDDQREVASGIYYITIGTANNTIIRKLTLIK